MRRAARYSSLIAALAGCGAPAPREPCPPAAQVEPLPSSTTPVQAPAPVAGPLETEYGERAKRIVDASVAHHAAFDKLAFLTDRIGHRLSGSKALDRAIEWARAALEKDGHENVHVEKVMVPHWDRGEESASITAPQPKSLRILGLGGTVATPKAGVSAEVVVVRTFEELDALGAGAKDKIVLFNAAMPPYSDEKGAGYGETVKYRSSGPSRAAKLGAKAVLVRSVTAHSLQTPHTGGLNYDKDLPKIPAAAVTVEDAELIDRLTRSGQKVTVTLELGARQLPDAPSANVVADLRGSELPEEMVIIGAHIDSWDVGQGAHDDGAGCVMVMQALTELRQLGLRPRRTIRVVLFTNEENGLAGGKAYAQEHAAEIPKIVAAFEGDIGGYAPIGLRVEAPADKSKAMAARTKDVLSLLAGLGVKRVEDGFSGADLIPLTKAGVVGLGLVTDHRTYFDIHHTDADTLDKVDKNDLAKNVATVAVLSYVIADMKERFDAPSQ